MYPVKLRENPSRVGFDGMLNPARSATGTVLQFWIRMTKNPEPGSNIYPFYSRLNFSTLFLFFSQLIPQFCLSFELSFVFCLRRVQYTTPPDTFEQLHLLLNTLQHSSTLQNVSLFFTQLLFTDLPVAFHKLSPNFYHKLSVVNSLCAVSQRKTFKKPIRDKE